MVKTIYLHGFTGDSISLTRFAKVVGYPESYLIDMPEFGKNHRQYAVSWSGYTTAVMETIHEQVGPGPYRIIGHSYGAMVTYVLALDYPDEIESVALICPSAYGRWLSNAGKSVGRVLSYVIGEDNLLRIHRSPVVVDAITWINKAPDWPKEAYGPFKAQRRREAGLYTKSMVRLLDIIKDFPRLYNDTKISQPTCLIFAKYDLVVSKRDVLWYRERTVGNIAFVGGGHAVPVILPEEVAHKLHENFAPVPSNLVEAETSH